MPYIPGSRKIRLELALQRELDGDEHVVWQGMQLGKLNPMSFGIYLFAVPWTGFALFWVAMASVGIGSMDQADGPGWLAWAFPAFGIPFVVVGVGMLAAPFLPLWQSGKVLYAVTNLRVLRLNLGRKLDVKSLPAERIGLVERNESRRGEGSIRLAVNVGRDSDGDKTTEHFQFGEVSDIMGAHEAIRKLRRTRESGSAL